MKARPLSRRRIAVCAIGVLAVVAVLWSAAWLAVARRLESGIDGWVRDRRAEGWSVTHGPVAVGGFPFRWQARIDRPQLVRARGTAGGFFWSGPWIGLGWAPWTARSVSLWTAGAHELGLEGEAGERFGLTANEITGRLEFGDGGAIERLYLGGDAVALTPPGSRPDGGTFRVDRATLHANLRPEAKSAPGTPLPALALDADILGFTLPATVRAALGRTIGRIAGRATVMGAVPAGRPAEALTAWRDAGGVVEIPSLSLGWGPLAAAGEGTLALDIGLQPIAALTARIRGYAETVDRLRAAGALSVNQALAARLALAALAQTPQGGGRKEVPAAVSLQDRLLAVGPIPLLRLPYIDWQ